MESESAANVDIFKFLPTELRKARVELNWKCVEPVLLKMLEEGLHADITLVAQGGSVKAHRSVLASVSPVFCAMFQHNMKEQLTSTVDIRDMSIDGLQLFLLVLYTTNEYTTNEYTTIGNGEEAMAELVRGSIDEHFYEIWGAAHKYQVVTRLEFVLLKALKRNLTPDNCWDYCNGSLPRSSTFYVCCEYILRNYDVVIESESILEEMRRNPQRVQGIMKMARLRNREQVGRIQVGKTAGVKRKS